MSELEVLLAEIARLNASVRPGDAQAAVQELLARLSISEVCANEVGLRRAIDTFLPKRRRLLTSELDRVLTRISVGHVTPSPPVVEASPALRPFRTVVPAPSREESTTAGHSHARGLADVLERDLHDLSAHHIFQWGTFYRDILSEHFDTLLDAFQELDRPTELLSLVRAALSAHSSEIFAKGYGHLASRYEAGVERFATTKSLNGLQRFLDLPLEFYSTKLTEQRDVTSARALRAITSAMLSAILRGYALTTFEQDGSKVLPRFPRSWAHVLPFLTDWDLAETLTLIEPGPFRDSVLDSVKPLVEALNVLADRDQDYAPLPALSQLVWPQRRLDVALHLPPESGRADLLPVQCYLEGAFVDRQELEEASARGVIVSLAPMHSDLRLYVASSKHLLGLAVPTNDDRQGRSASDRVVSILDEAIHVRGGADSLTRPLDFNFAKTFPLENPFLTKYVHVYRSSVRQLLQAYERRNGVRLWCSVRRSGKTTACSVDLDSTTGRSMVVAQTCDDTGQIPGGSQFYAAVCQALDAGRQLSPDFVRETVAHCAFGQRSVADRYVLVLDEYETLFGRLREDVRKEPGLRYSVVQPLLNQFVSFTNENLLVFLGQQPNAHFILMDQNQLSAYVEQDAFPLFSHDPDTSRGEFSELLRRVLTDRVEFDGGFANAAYGETGGHPYLTVNLLVEFMEWLISTRRPVGSLDLSADDMVQFAAVGLSTQAIRLSGTYDFFKAAAADATSADGRAQNPWLHAVYMSLREMAHASPTTLTCSLDDFLTIATPYCAAQHGVSAEDILSTGSRANFFTMDGESVRPRTRLLGRIAAALPAGVSP